MKKILLTMILFLSLFPDLEKKSIYSGLNASAYQVFGNEYPQECVNMAQQPMNQAIDNYRGSLYDCLFGAAGAAADAWIGSIGNGGEGMLNALWDLASTVQDLFNALEESYSCIDSATEVFNEVVDDIWDTYADCDTWE